MWWNRKGKPMSSDNRAAQAWEAHTAAMRAAHPWIQGTVQGRGNFIEGFKSRDAEVEALRTRLAETEAIIANAPHVDCATEWDGPEHSYTCNCWKSKIDPEGGAP
jgi:Rieske Fe-S protein